MEHLKPLKLFKLFKLFKLLKPLKPFLCNAAHLSKTPHSALVR